MKLWVGSLAPQTLDILVPACNLSAGEVEARGFEVPEEAGDLVIELSTLLNWVWYHMPVVPAFRRATEEDQRFKAIFSYIVNLRLAWATQNPVSKKKK